MSFVHTLPVFFRNMSLMWILSLLKFAAHSKLSATFEDSVRNLFISPWHSTWLQMTHELSLGSGDVIVLDLFGRVNGDVSGERSSFQAFFFGISTSCLAPFFLYALFQDLTWYLISANLFCSIFVTRPSSRFLLVLIIVCLPATVLVSLNEPALSLTF